MTGDSPPSSRISFFLILFLAKQQKMNVDQNEDEEGQNTLSQTFGNALMSPPPLLSANDYGID